MYQVGDVVLTLITGGIFTLSNKKGGEQYDVLEKSHLSTASSLFVTKTQQQLDEKAQTKILNLQFLPTDVKNQFRMHIEDGDVKSVRSCGLLIGNKVRHSIRPSRVLQNYMPSNGEMPCMHEGWGIPAKTVLEADDLWKQGPWSTYCMAEKFVTMTYKILQTLVGFKKQGRWIRGINGENVVFQKNDIHHRYPQLKDCLILTDDESEDTRFKSLATFIQSSIKFDEKLLDPTVKSLLNCLNEKTPYSITMLQQKKWKYLLGHLLFMTSDEKATLLISMRDRVRGQKAIELKVEMKELMPSSASCKSWDILINQDRLPLFFHARVKKMKANALMDRNGIPINYNNYNKTQVSGIIIFLRDTYEHVNDMYTLDNANGRFYYPEDFAKCTELVAPELLPSYFDHHVSGRNDLMRLYTYTCQLGRNDLMRVA
ncbi:uncharacterized protein LOC113340750 isoform X1 [Papaver somniferum]|uniref:uncharacterized protein LOC113340750 isoform X1 n=1 Tax=Papaver somniferum TaxID=3469 RepID=UPI000E702956|nr:uncharacterized protein LOC113340750 isoform X1 [Papaver somniferum]